jgi:hypothetical protein
LLRGFWSSRQVLSAGSQQTKGKSTVASVAGAIAPSEPAKTLAEKQRDPPSHEAHDDFERGARELGAAWHARSGAHPCERCDKSQEDPARMFTSHIRFLPGLIGLAQRKRVLFWHASGNAK